MAIPTINMLSQLPGGGINAVYNSIQDKALEQEKNKLFNKYYSPDMESQIEQRNALTNLDKIKGQYLPEKMQLANQYQNMVNQMYVPNIQSEISHRDALTNQTNTMTPLEAEQLRIRNKFYPQLTAAQIENMKAQANLRNLGGSTGMGAGQKEMIGLQNQLQIDHPEWDKNTINQAASSYLSGNDTLPNGNKLPPLSGLAQSQIAQIHKRNSNATLQNQAANMSVLANDLNDIDISPVMRFAGFKGKLDFAKYAADMARGKSVPEDFREYLAFRDVTSNFAMDALRKGFGTSVVPPYVYATLGKASNPSSTWWYDPTQVVKDWETTKNWINKNAESYTKKATQGISSNISNKKESPKSLEENDPLGIR